MISRKNKLPKKEWGKTKTSKFIPIEVEIEQEKEIRMMKTKRQSNQEYLEAKKRKKELPMNDVVKLSNEKYSLPCKNDDCKNKRRHCSCFCEECSKKYKE